MTTPCRLRPVAVSFTCLTLAWCSSAPAQSVTLHAAASVSYPVAVATGTPNAAGHPTIIVAERLGTVRLIDTTTGAVAPTPLLTVSQPVYSNGDAGLQCVTLGPDAFTGPGGHAYVYYNTSSTTAILERQTLSADHTYALPGTAQTILRYQRPEGHNGGWLGFSPLDGYLYLSLGDGGSAAVPDPTNAAQSLTGPNVLQGKLLRLDPSSDDFPADPDRNFHIPDTNPLIGMSTHEEVWDYGLRNPWRCAFDPANDDLWIADVGQDTWEEINVERHGTPSGAGGHNYGWKCFEASQFTGYSPCTSSLPFTPPLYAYTHQDGCSITGGIIYRGTQIPSLNGAYLFSDFCTPTIWVLRTPGGAEGVPTRSTLILAGTPPIEAGSAAPTAVVAFGADSAGEPYFADYFSGRIYRIGPPACAADLGGAGGLPTPDGSLDNNDFIAFINDFFDADPHADCGSAGGIVGADGAYDNNDFIAFINLFFSGC